MKITNKEIEAVSQLEAFQRYEYFIKQVAAYGKKIIDDGTLAKGMQDVGDGVAVVGYAFTLSGVGAEVGVPLAGVGNIISSGGSALELAKEIKNEDLGGAGKTIAFKVTEKLVEKGLNKVLPGAGKAVKDKDFDLGSEILRQGASLKISFAEKAVDSTLEQNKKR